MDATGDRDTLAGSRPFLEDNRALWDEWAVINHESDFYRVGEFKRGTSKLRGYELEEVGPVAGKSLLHLQCHFGLDTLSWAREGAIVTGADFSDQAIALARGLAAELAIQATFVRSDLYELPNVLDGPFDVVYTSRGILGWLPDLARWGQVIAHFLRPGGIFYITEVHPFLQVMDDDDGVTELRLRFHYFPRPEPVTFPVQGSYADRTAPLEQKVEHWWQHSVSEIVGSLIDAGLDIEFFHEFPFLEWPAPGLVERDGRWWLPETQEGEIPLFFSLRARKP